MLNHERSNEYFESINKFRVGYFCGLKYKTFSLFAGNHSLLKQINENIVPKHIRDSDSST